MATITEDYVSFETAKLLKEKGFDADISIPHAVYSLNNGTFINLLQFIGNTSFINYNLEKCVVAPTLQMVMKWLREVYKIHIQIWILEEKGYWFDIEKILNAQYKHKSLYSSGLEDIYFESYEQACEAAIEYCLENLI